MLPKRCSARCASLRSGERGCKLHSKCSKCKCVALNFFYATYVEFNVTTPIPGSPIVAMRVPLLDTRRACALVALSWRRPHPRPSDSASPPNAAVDTLPQMAHWVPDGVKWAFSPFLRPNAGSSVLRVDAAPDTTARSTDARVQQRRPQPRFHTRPAITAIVHTCHMKRHARVCPVCATCLLGIPASRGLNYPHL